jgi:hypothetical protein
MVHAMQRNSKKDEGLSVHEPGGAEHHSAGERNAHPKAIECSMASTCK